MTEKEAIELIKTTSLMRYEVISGKQSYLGDAMRMAVQALAKQTMCNEILHEWKEAREKAIDEVLKVVKETYHNFSGYDLEHMTKYGNETAEQQHQSYSSLMLYEIAMEFDDLLDRIESMKLKES